MDRAAKIAFKSWAFSRAVSCRFQLSFVPSSQSTQGKPWPPICLEIAIERALPYVRAVPYTTLLLQCPNSTEAKASVRDRRSGGPWSHSMLELSVLTSIAHLAGAVDQSPVAAKASPSTDDPHTIASSLVYPSAQLNSTRASRNGGLENGLSAHHQAVSAEAQAQAQASATSSPPQYPTSSPYSYTTKDDRITSGTPPLLPPLQPHPQHSPTPSSS